MVPYAREYPCNWLQITENAMDPVHAVFLHARVSGPQFAESWGQMGVHEFHERESGLYYTNARRVGHNIWVRIHEVILPNLTHAGAVMSMDGETIKYFGRNSFTRWVVPVDDETTRVIAWANYGERTDPVRADWMVEAGIDELEDVRSGVDDKYALERAALEGAAKAAKLKAEAMASGLGIRLGMPVEVGEDRLMPSLTLRQQMAEGDVLEEVVVTGSRRGIIDPMLFVPANIKVRGVAWVRFEMLDE